MVVWIKDLGLGCIRRRVKQWLGAMGFKIQCLGFRVKGLRCRVLSLRFGA
jgi:hypothetical protein